MTIPLSSMEIGLIAFSLVREKDNVAALSHEANEPVYRSTDQVRNNCTKLQIACLTDCSESHYF